MNKNKIILDLCGGTGSWSKPYKDAGYDVRLITLPGNDVRELAPLELLSNHKRGPLNKARAYQIYGVLAAPPCDQFSIAKHFHGKGNYQHDFKKGLEVVSACCRVILTCRPTFWAIENPANGLLRKWMGVPAYKFEPWEYGDPYQKGTALWGQFHQPVVTHKKPNGLKKFSMLKSKEIYPEFYGVYDRTTRRAMTPPGFARAFFEANQ